MGKPKCGWRYEVCDEMRRVVTVWATFGQAKSSMARLGSFGWTVRHEGSGVIVARVG